MQKLPPNITNELNFSTDNRHSAHAYGNIGVYVVATVSLIAFVEETCGQLLFPFLGSEEISVGTLVSVKHKASTPIGSKIRCCVSLNKQDNHKFLFSVSVFNKERLLLEGTHGRVVCSKDTISQ